MGLLDNVKKNLGLGPRDHGEKHHTTAGAAPVDQTAESQAARQSAADLAGAQEAQEAQQDHEAGPEAAESPTAGRRVTEVVVEPGDTMAGIAAQFGVDLGALIATNAATVPNPDVIYPGQVLRLP